MKFHALDAIIIHQDKYNSCNRQYKRRYLSSCTLSVERL